MKLMLEYDDLLSCIELGMTDEAKAVLGYPLAEKLELTVETPSMTLTPDDLRQCQLIVGQKKKDGAA